MAPTRFLDRRDAGRHLASALRAFAHRSDVLVLALPRGGVPVAREVADALEAPLDVLVVRKLGMPGHAELAMGAVASGDIRVFNRDVITRFGISQAAIDRVTAAERTEVARREQLYRGDAPPLDVTDRTVLLVDDGLATGATMSAAVAALRELHPARVIVAVPVAARDAMHLLRQTADDCVSVLVPEALYGVGFWYDDFAQTSDAEVRGLLASGRPRPVAQGLPA